MVATEFTYSRVPRRRYFPLGQSTVPEAQLMPEAVDDSEDAMNPATRLCWVHWKLPVENHSDPETSSTKTYLWPAVYYEDYDEFIRHHNDQLDDAEKGRIALRLYNAATNPPLMVTRLLGVPAIDSQDTKIQFVELTQEHSFFADFTAWFPHVQKECTYPEVFESHPQLYIPFMQGIDEAFHLLDNKAPKRQIMFGLAQARLDESKNPETQVESPTGMASRPCDNAQNEQVNAETPRPEESCQAEEVTNQDPEKQNEVKEATPVAVAASKSPQTVDGDESSVRLGASDWTVVTKSPDSREEQDAATEHDHEGSPDSQDNKTECAEKDTPLPTRKDYPTPALKQGMTIQKALQALYFSGWNCHTTPKGTKIYLPPGGKNPLNEMSAVKGKDYFHLDGVRHFLSKTYKFKATESSVSASSSPVSTTNAAWTRFGGADPLTEDGKPLSQSFENDTLSLTTSHLDRSKKSNFEGISEQAEECEQEQKSHEDCPAVENNEPGPQPSATDLKLQRQAVTSDVDQDMGSTPVEPTVGLSTANNSLKQSPRKQSRKSKRKQERALVTPNTLTKRSRRSSSKSNQSAVGRNGYVYMPQVWMPILKRHLGWTSTNSSNQVHYFVYLPPNSTGEKEGTYLVDYFYEESEIMEFCAKNNFRSLYSKFLTNETANLLNSTAEKEGARVRSKQSRAGKKKQDRALVTPSALTKRSKRSTPKPTRSKKSKSNLPEDAYDFNTWIDVLRKQLNWNYRKASHSLKDWVYLPPKSKGEKNGRYLYDFFYEENEVMDFCRENNYYEKFAHLLPKPQVQ